MQSTSVYKFEGFYWIAEGMSYYMTMHYFTTAPTSYNLPKEQMVQPN